MKGVLAHFSAWSPRNQDLHFVAGMISQKLSHVYEHKKVMTWIPQYTVVLMLTTEQKIRL